jgi:hypothetical protein
VRDGTWHNILLSHARGAIVSVYVDGTLVDTRADLTTGNIDTDDLGYAVNVGQDGRGTYTDGIPPNGSAGITNALLDDLGIWRRALSGQEASAIYTAGQSGKDLAQASVTGTIPTKVTISATLSGSSLLLTWPSNPLVKLQQTGTLTSPTWADVPGTLGAGSATIPIVGTAAFFRLSQ